MPRDFPRRYLVLWLPFLATDRVRRSRQHTCDRAGSKPLDPACPLVLVAKAEGTEQVMAADAVARALKLEPGMALAQARAMVPTLCTLPHEPADDLAWLERIADWADRYTPLVGRDRPDGLILDITGAAHLAGGEDALAAEIVARLGRVGFTARVAIAPTVGAAWALSRHADGGSLRLSEQVTRSGLDAALAPLPVAALRLLPDTAAALQRVGLKRIGDLIGRPRAALAARFGAALVLQLDRARGIDTESISPRQPIPPASVDQGFAEPILTTDAVEVASRALADRLADLLETRGEGATRFVLSIWRVDGLVKRIAVNLASPCRVGKTMAGLIALRLDHLDDPLDPGFGYDHIRLAATAVAPKPAEARSLAGLDATREAVSLAEACAPLIDRLAARFGAARVNAITFTDSHCPERAAKLRPAGETTAHGARASGLPAERAPPRPLRLYDPPEPVDVMAEVPDGPPIQIRWRRRPLRIVAAEGPERIAPEWWRRAGNADLAASTRDYWRIEDTTGRRLWIYREGFYGTAAVHSGADDAFSVQSSPVPPRWYVHGLFA